MVCGAERLQKNNLTRTAELEKVSSYICFVGLCKHTYGAYWGKLAEGECVAPAVGVFFLTFFWHFFCICASIRTHWESQYLPGLVLTTEMNHNIIYKADPGEASVVIYEQPLSIQGLLN